MEESLLQILLTLLLVKLIFFVILFPSYPIPLTIFMVETTNFASTGEGKIFC